MASKTPMAVPAFPPADMLCDCCTLLAMERDDSVPVLEEVAEVVDAALETVVATAARTADDEAVTIETSEYADWELEAGSVLVAKVVVAAELLSSRPVADALSDASLVAVSEEDWAGLCERIGIEAVNCWEMVAVCVCCFVSVVEVESASDELTSEELEGVPI